MTRGKAFAIKTTNASPSTVNSSTINSVPVYKSWVHLQGRTFLIEEVPLAHLAAALDALPLTARNEKQETRNWKLASAAASNSYLLTSSSSHHFPPSHEFIADTNQILIASAEMNKQPGVVLDYVVEVDSGTTGDFTFYAGTTYFISGPVSSFGGSLTFEGGTVIKHPNDTPAYLEFDGDPVSPATAGPPAVFTAADDDSIGESVDGVWGGYSGIISGSYASPALMNSAGFSLYNMRFFYASQAVLCNDQGDFDFEGCQIVGGSVIDFEDSWSSQSLTMNNCLVVNAGNIVTDNNTYKYPYGGGCNVLALNNCTIDNYWQIIGGLSGDGDSMTAVNSIFSNLSLDDFDPDTDWGYYPMPAYGSHNGFYNTWINSESAGIVDPYAFGGNPIPPTNYPYETAASANYYLAAGSPYRDVGTTDIDPGLLAELQAMTTCAPQDGGHPDNDGLPDLGYHYPVNEDSDYDGLPDGWEWHWFGNYDHTGSELDINGYTSLFDYENGRDPISLITMVVAWGDNSYGQCDVPTGLTNAIQVAGGFDFSLALKADSTVVAWGNNMGGATNVPSNLTNVISIAAGGEFALALLQNGTVVGWGTNNDGQTSVPAGLTNVAAVAAGDACSFALRNDGTIVAWGYNGYGQTNVPAIGPTTQVAAGVVQGVALLTNSTVAVWANNDYPSPCYGWYVTNVPAGLSNVVSVAAGAFHTLALQADGMVTAWGAGGTNIGSYEDYGQSIVPTGLSNVVAVAGGYLYSVALQSGGTLTTWGDDTYGELDLPDRADRRENNLRRWLSWFGDSLWAIDAANL